MGGSIIEQIEKKRKRKKQLAFKRKREKEKLMKQKERQKQEKKETPKKNIIPVYKRKIEAGLQEHPVSEGYGSLPVGLTTAQKRMETIEEQTPQLPQTVEPAEPAEPAPSEAIMKSVDPTPTARTQEYIPEIKDLINKGTKEDLQNFLSGAIRNGKVVHLPGINSSNFKFPDYGYRRLIEHMIESKDLLRILVDIETSQGITFVNLSDYIRPKEDPADADNEKVIPAELTLRGLEGLCEILYNSSAEFELYENEWKHLNNLLECFAQPEVKGRSRSWEIETEKARIKISATNTGEVWEYKIERE